MQTTYYAMVKMYAMYAQISEYSVTTTHATSVIITSSHQCAIMASTSRHGFLCSFDVGEISSWQTLRQKQSEDVDKDTDPAGRHLDPH